MISFAELYDLFNDGACMRVQLCTEALWEAIMAQVATLDMSQQALPEEALTQMYQARCCTCLPLLVPVPTEPCQMA